MVRQAPERFVEPLSINQTESFDRQTRRRCGAM